MNRNKTICFTGLLFAVVITLLFPLHSFAFGILAHEANIDNAWEKSIRPLLKIKYPRATDSALQVAHSYAYGGAIIPDIGYYPFCSAFFTNLIHYVDNGDFINTLIDSAQDVNEYAFALGVLSHYFTDEFGHPLCTNHVVPVLFPELQKEFGDIITYEQAETEHSRVEYGFDVVQTAIGNYKTEDYHSFIGFQVSQPLLERAFLKTYKFELKQIFNSLSIEIALFRFTVNNIVPELTRDAYRIRKSIISELNPLEEKDKYEYNIDKVAYEKEFGTIPIKAIVLSFIVGLIPKIGPLEVYKFKEPSPEVLDLFKKTMNTILLNYSKYLKRLRTAHKRSPRLENINFDTGKKTVIGDYKLADETYRELIKKQKKKQE
ncbi:MAG: zinc dependent phospholipase C family protein [FCB group bacterium]|jgi:hypothetical protein